MSSYPDSEEILDNFRLNSIRKSLLDWWKQNKRHYPWRNTKNPYKVLIAEILLHRTQANQVVPVFKSFLEHFPNIQVLIESKEDELLNILYPLGLLWRNKLLYIMAKEIATRFDGTIPEGVDELTSLPGVSHYIASAVRCFSFGYPDVLLDTNTVRVTGRVFGLRIDDSSRRSKVFRHLLEQFIDTIHPREFNWALIDFAALICKSRTPDHEQCPIAKYCKYYFNAGTLNTSKG